MSYFVIKATPRFEYRIYVENNDVLGKPIYQGHKGGLENNLLSEILDYRIEKSTGKIFFKNYETNDWILEGSKKLEDNIQKCWDTLEARLKKEFGNFRKISITKYNI